MQQISYSLYPHLPSRVTNVRSLTMHPRYETQKNSWWYSCLLYLQRITFIDFNLLWLLLWMVFCPHLLYKTCTIYGTLVLDISQRMLYDKHPYMSQVYPLFLFLLLYLPAKDMLWERWSIDHFCPLIKGLLNLLYWFTQISLVLCQLNHTHMPSMFLYSLMIIQVMHLLCSYITKTLLHSIFSLWLTGLRPSLVNCLPLYVQTKGGNSWAKSFKCSFCPEALHIKLQFPIHPSKTVMQRDSIKFCLKKLKPYDNMLVCIDLSGKTQLGWPCISTTNNPCVIIYGKHPLKYSMETNLMFHTSGFLAHMPTCSYLQNSNKISCLLRPRRWYLLDMNLT